MNELPLDPKKAVFVLDSGKYLRIVAALQQLLTNSIESFQLEPTITRQFIDRLIEESEKLRKYLKLLEMTPKELKVSTFIKLTFLPYLYCFLLFPHPIMILYHT